MISDEYHRITSQKEGDHASGRIVRLGGASSPCTTGFQLSLEGGVPDIKPTSCKEPWYAHTRRIVENPNPVRRVEFRARERGARLAPPRNQGPLHEMDPPFASRAAIKCLFSSFSDLPFFRCRPAIHCTVVVPARPVNVVNFPYS